MDVTRPFFFKPIDVTDVEYFRGSICALGDVMAMSFLFQCIN